MDAERDVYGWQERLDNSLRRIAESGKISEKNKKTISNFIENYKKMYRKKKNRDLSTATLVKAVDRLLTIGEVCGKQDFKSIDTEKKMDGLIEKIEARKYKPNSLKTVKIYVKMLWRFLRFENCYYPNDPKETMNIKIVVEEEKITQDDVMTDDEFLKVIAQEKELMWKSLIFCHRSAGVRESEIIQLKIGDVHPDEISVRINVTGKEGPYSSRLLDNYACKILLEFLAKHPEKDNPNAPLWITRKRKIAYDENGKKIVHIENIPLNYKTYSNHWRMLQMRAGLRRIFPLHNLRRQSSISMLRAGYSSDIINQNQGRKPNSKAISRYQIWNDARAVDNAFLRQNGKTVKIPKSKLAGKTCGVCGKEDISPELEKCPRCLRYLDTKKALEEQEESFKAQLNALHLQPLDELRIKQISREEAMKIRAHDRVTEQLRSIMIREMSRDPVLREKMKGISDGLHLREEIIKFLKEEGLDDKAIEEIGSSRKDAKFTWELDESELQEIYGAEQEAKQTVRQKK